MHVEGQLQPAPPPLHNHSLAYLWRHQWFTDGFKKNKSVTRQNRISFAKQHRHPHRQVWSYDMFLTWTGNEFENKTTSEQSAGRLFAVRCHLTTAKWQEISRYHNSRQSHVFSYFCCYSLTDRRSTLRVILSPSPLLIHSSITVTLMSVSNLSLSVSLFVTRPNPRPSTWCQGLKSRCAEGEKNLPNASNIASCTSIWTVY